MPQADAAAQPIRRQAIVVVHGQGQQRPMGTIREFVDVLWRYNHDLGEVPDGGRQVWIVPDGKSGLYELQRITTPEHKGRRTDFYELYYADLLDNTPIRNLWLWLQRLLWIDPEDVTPELRWPWRVVWMVSLVAVGLFISVLLSVPDLLHLQWTAVLGAPRTWMAAAVIGVALALLLGPKFVLGLAGLKAIPVWLPVLAIVAGVGVIFADTYVVWGAALLGYLGYFAWTFLLPLFGDAASYLSAQTETVRSRQALRERGFRLLKALHEDPDCERVVIVAHSLGSVLAYDLLQILWQAVGPTKENPPTEPALAALRAVEAFVEATGEEGWSAERVAAYQQLQWAAFQALRQPRPAPGEGVTIPGWKISDFVSLGSPLGNAQFLVAEGRSDFARLKAERLLPTSPPQAYDRRNGPGFLDPVGNVAHHGAVFGAVRWTNIYDSFHRLGFIIGDPISAPVAGALRFGGAIADEDVEVRRPTPLPRFFTHNHYWHEPLAGWPKPASEHIRRLRAAVGFERD